MATLSVEDFEAILYSGYFADFTIVCGGRDIQVHRMVICPNSNVIEAACTGQFGDNEIDGHGRWEMDEEDYGTVCRMLSYLYMGDYSDCTVPNLGVPSAPRQSGTGSAVSHPIDAETSSAASDDNPSFPTPSNSTDTSSTVDLAKYLSVLSETKRSPIIENVNVHRLAAKLEIASLKDLAMKKFLSQAEANFSQPTFCHAAEFVYTLTDFEDLQLRAAVTRICIEKLDETMACAELTSILEKHVPMAWTLLKEVKTSSRGIISRQKVLNRKAAENFQARDSERIIEVANWREEAEVFEEQCQGMRDGVDRLIEALATKKTTCDSCGVRDYVGIEKPRDYRTFPFVLHQCRGMWR